MTTNSPLNVFFVLCGFAAGVSISGLFWRHRINRALVQLARLSQGRPVMSEDLTLAFTPRMPGIPASVRELGAKPRLTRQNGAVK